MVDLEPTVADQVRTGVNKRLFHPDSILSGAVFPAAFGCPCSIQSDLVPFSLQPVSYLFAGKEDASSNYARGRFTIGREMIDVAMDRLRRMVDRCESLQVRNAIRRPS